MEEEIIVTSEESESSSEEEAGEEYSVEETTIEAKELNPADVELMLKKSEIWDRLVRGEISIAEAYKIFAEISLPTISEGVKKRRRRR